MTDQSTWPAHLRDSAPRQRCGRCGRWTWSIEDFGRECRMPQPDTYPCGGRFGPPCGGVAEFQYSHGEPAEQRSFCPSMVWEPGIAATHEHWRIVVRHPDGGMTFEPWQPVSDTQRHARTAR